MKRLTTLALATAILLTACGSLEKKSALVSAGDTKAHVLEVMGPADDRQVQGSLEAWQWCQTGAGFGYHDYRVIWFESGRVTGLNSYKSGRPGSSCMTDIRPVRWEDAPDTTVEIRHR